MLKKNRVSIEIGEKDIRILVGNKDEVAFYGSITTPEGAVEGDKLLNVEAVASAINTFINSNKIKEKRLSFVIESRDIVTRNMEAPIMEEEGIKKAVEWETAQYLPSAEDNYYIDFEITDKIVNENKKVYKIFIAAVPKTRIDSYVELSKALNMELVSIDISSNCIARVFKGIYNKGNNESIGIIDINDSSSSMIILDKGKLFIERAVPFGMNNIYKLINRQELEDFNLLNLRQANDNDQKIQTMFENVFSSFDRIIQFYTSGKTQKKLDRIFIIGKGASLQSLEEYVENRFGTSAGIIKRRVDINLKVKINKQFDFSLYIKALGVLLRKE